jgi:hypothetical protein
MRHIKHPVLLISNKQNCYFLLLLLLYKIGKQEGGKDPSWGVGVLVQCKGEEVRKWLRRVNMVQILFTQVCKRKSDIL